MEKLKKYATMFGLDSTSGLEIPETDPQISDEDSVRSAMGQGTNNYTTSQLARYITAVANEGTVYDLSLIDRVEDIDGDVILQNEPKIKNTVEGISKNTWDLVHAGMQGLSQTILAFSVRSYPVILLFPVKPVLHSRVPHIRTMDYLWDLHPAILAIKRLWH